jgi:hypothetical protein
MVVAFQGVLAIVVVDILLKKHLIGFLKYDPKLTRKKINSSPL